SVVTALSANPWVEIFDVVQDDEVRVMSVNCHECVQLPLYILRSGGRVETPLDVPQLLSLFEVLVESRAAFSEVPENVPDLPRLHRAENARPDSHDVRVRRVVQNRN